VRILELLLPGPDPQPYYDGMLGLPVEGLSVFFGATRVSFEPGPHGCTHFAVNVAPERFEEAVRWARERVELVGEPVEFPEWRARAAYFHDPSGNIVELIARERAPGKELLMEVSEVGLPVADVARAVEFLQAELDLPHFDGDRRHFSALGDDRGLFIVVPVGRIWAFSEAPAADVPLHVRIEGPEARTLEVPGSLHVIETVPR
jgi:catechol-2,3-dioxygenase